MQDRGREVGSSLLFFGCRTPDEDFYCRDELEGYEHRGLSTLRPAFSRLADTP